MIVADLQWIDYLIIAIYFGFVIGLGIYFSTKQKTEADYFLAGRSLLWPIIGFSLFASNMSSISLVGLAESGFKSGFSVFSYEWMASIVLIIFAVFFLPFYLKNNVYTVPEFLEKRFGQFARYYFSTVSIILNLFVDIASALFAGAIVVQMVFPELTLTQIVWIISIVAGFYTLLGGLSSVVYSDTVQAILLIGGSVIITVIAYNQVGGWSEITASVAPEKLRIIKSADDEALPWPGLFSGVFLLGFYFWITNQYIAQRALASKDARNGQWGAIFAGFLKLLTLFIMVLPGVMAVILYPDLEDAKQVYPTLVFDILPTGILGLVLAGFIAALMSSVDSGLNAASTLFTMDFYRKYNKNADSAQTLKVAKIMVGLFMLIAAIWAPYINNFPSIWDYLQMVLSFICPPIVALFIFGLFFRKVNTNGANAAIIVGITLGISAVLYKVYININDIEVDILPHYLYLAGIIFVACAVILMVFSYLFPEKEQRDLSKLIWTRTHFREETLELSDLPFYKNYRLQAILLVVVIVAMLIIF